MADTAVETSSQDSSGLVRSEGIGEGEKITESRLMISKIVCENFKSYAGVKELGPFHKVRESTLRLMRNSLNTVGWHTSSPLYRTSPLLWVPMGVASPT